MEDERDRGPLPKILITGGTGFVGRHLTAALDAIDADYVAFSRREYDLTGKASTDRVFSENRHAGIIIHLACYQAAAEFPARHPGEQFFTNSQIHLNVLEGWRRYLPGAKLIAIGSSCAYPSAVARMAEDQFMEGSIHGSVYAYAFTKRLLHQGIAAYNDQYGLNGSYLIPATMYGEFDDFDVETAHVCGALIHKFVTAQRMNLPAVEIWGDGSQVRDVIYVKDFVRLLVRLLLPIERDVLNISSGIGTSIRELAVAIQKAVGYGGELTFNAHKYTGIQEKTLAIDKLQSKYGLTPAADALVGIAPTVTWFQDHYETLKDRKKFT